ncbi:MAG TPA: hypothetical protein VFP08_13375 [Acidimicrobiales bacterium]|nr:hypothetical protein [Acidimicrobiales bacterium]
MERRAVVSVSPGQRAAQAPIALHQHPGRAVGEQRSPAGQRADRAEFDVAGRARVVADERLQLQRPQSGVACLRVGFLSFLYFFAPLRSP